MKHLIRRLLAGSCFLPLLLASADWAETIRPVLTGKVKHLKLEKKIYRTDRRTTITGLKDVTIDGNGATLLMSRKDHIFKIEDCTNFTIRNLTLDFDPMIFTQVKITRVSADGRTIEFEVEKGYPDLVPDLIANESLEVFLPDGTLRTDLGRLSGKPEILTPRRGRSGFREPPRSASATASPSGGASPTSSRRSAAGGTRSKISPSTAAAVSPSACGTAPETTGSSAAA